jgi:hypothetical protein
MNSVRIYETENLQIEIIGLRLCSRICFTSWLMRKWCDSAINYRKLKNKTFKTPYEYSKILSGTKVLAGCGWRSLRCINLLGG